jgi:hypothetical protein
MGVLARSVVVVGLWASVSLAQSSLPVTLIWQAPEPCPQREEVWRRLTDRLGRAPQTPAGTTLAARGVAEPTPEGAWKVELQTLTESGTGHRTLTAPDCEELTRRTVVVLALAIDPLLPPPPEVRPRSAWVSLGPSMSVGVLPLAAAGLLVDGRFEADPWSVELGLGTTLSLGQPVPFEGAAVSAVVPLIGLVNACAGRTWARFRLGGCVEARSSMIQLLAAGVDRPVSTSATLEVGPRLEARFLLSTHWALRALGGPTISVIGPVHQTPQGMIIRAYPLVTGFAALLVELRIW